jgi:hypothetical protein
MVRCCIKKIGKKPGQQKLIDVSVPTYYIHPQTSANWLASTPSHSQHKFRTVNPPRSFTSTPCNSRASPPPKQGTEQSGPTRLNERGSFGARRWPELSERETHKHMAGARRTTNVTITTTSVIVLDPVCVALAHVYTGYGKLLHRKLRLCCGTNERPRCDHEYVARLGRTQNRGRSCARWTTGRDTMY